MAKMESYDQGTPCWVELTTPDPAAGAAFYGGLFGWSAVDAGEGYTIGQLDGAPVAGITGQMPELAGHPAFWGVYLAVDDVDAATAKVAAAGGTVSAGPFDVGTSGRMSAIQDPTGARVNLWQGADLVGAAVANEPGSLIWNEVVTPDAERAARFYADVLGMGTEVHDMGGGSYTGLTNTAGRMIGGAAAPMEGVPPHWNVYFNVADADATGAKVEELGGRVVAPNFDAAGVGRMGVYADPQGAMFLLMQAPSSDA